MCIFASSRRHRRAYILTHTYTHTNSELIEEEERQKKAKRKAKMEEGEDEFGLYRGKPPKMSKNAFQFWLARSGIREQLGEQANQVCVCVHLCVCVCQSVSVSVSVFARVYVCVCARARASDLLLCPPPTGGGKHCSSPQPRSFF